MKRESSFQKELIKELKMEFPGCVVLKNDACYIQGFPDLTILYGDRWAALEVKRGKDASHQPNQDFYVERLNEMSYASFVYPENKEEVIRELQQTLRPGRKTRRAKPK